MNTSVCISKRLLTCLCWFPPGAPEPNEPSPPDVAEFDAVICDFMRDQGIPGASLVLAKDGKIIYTQGKGSHTACKTDIYIHEIIYAAGHGNLYRQTRLFIHKVRVFIHKARSFIHKVRVCTY